MKKYRAYVYSQTGFYFTGEEKILSKEEADTLNNKIFPKINELEYFTLFTDDGEIHINPKNIFAITLKEVIV